MDLRWINPWIHLRSMDSTTIGVAIATTFSFGTVLALFLKYGYKWKLKVQELELILKTKDAKIEELVSNKKKSELEAGERIKLVCKNLNEQMARFEVVVEANKTLEKSVIDLRCVNKRQEELIKQLQGERAVYESQMRQTLNEMSFELRELQSRLSANSELKETKTNNEVIEMAQREKELRSEMRRLRRSLSALFPGIKVNGKPYDENSDSNWAGLYIAALKQLSSNVEDLSKAHHNDISMSPTKKSQDSTGNSPRTGSPTSNGRSSRGSSYYADKRLVETRLVESLALFCLRCLD